MIDYKELEILIYETEEILKRKVLQKELELLEKSIGFITDTSEGKIVLLKEIGGRMCCINNFFYANNVVGYNSNTILDLSPITESFVKDLVNILDVKFPIPYLCNIFGDSYNFSEVCSYLENHPIFFKVYHTIRLFWETLSWEEMENFQLNKKYLTVSDTFSKECLKEYLEKTQDYACKYKETLCADKYHKEALVYNMAREKEIVQDILKNKYLKLLDRFLQTEITTDEEAETAKKYADKNANWLLNLAKNQNIIYVYQQKQYSPCFYWEHGYRRNDGCEFYNTHYDLLVTFDENGCYNAIPVPVVEKLVGIRLYRELFDTVISKEDYYRMK